MPRTGEDGWSGAEPMMEARLAEWKRDEDRRSARAGVVVAVVLVAVLVVVAAGVAIVGLAAMT